NETARAAQVVVGIHVARAQRTAFVTTNGPDAPCIHVLDDGEGLATVGLAPVGHEVERQRVRTAQRNIVLVLPVQHVVAQPHGGEVGRQTAVVTLGGRQRAVAGGFGPADVEHHRIGAFAIFVNKITIGTRGVRAQPAQLVVFEADARKDAVVLGDRHAEVQAGAVGGDLVFTPGVVGVVGFGAPVEQGRGLAD